MPDQLEATPFVDNEPDDTVDADILRPTPVKPVFKPSSASRMRKLQVMPPPIETSTVATRTLQKEFKNLIKLQEENSLPFYIDSDTERYARAAWKKLTNQPLLLGARAVRVSSLEAQGRDEAARGQFDHVSS